MFMYFGLKVMNKTKTMKTFIKYQNHLNPCESDFEFDP